MRHQYKIMEKEGRKILANCGDVKIQCLLKIAVYNIVK